jgi:hypothetical protein
MAYGMERRQDGNVRKKPKKDTDLSSSVNPTVRHGLGRDRAFQRGDRSPAAMFGDERVPHPALMTIPSLPTIERAMLSATRHIRVTGR